MIIVSGCRSPDSKAIYVPMIENSGKWTKFFHFVLMRISVPVNVMLNCLISYYVYFATDSGNEAFRLAFPIWFVDKLTQLFH